MERGIDVLVLNHTSTSVFKAGAMTLDDLTATMKINFKGAVAVWKAVQATLPTMLNGGCGFQLGTRRPWC